MKTIAEIERELKQTKAARQKSLLKIANTEKAKVMVIDDNFISFDCNNLADVKAILTNFQPFINSWKITDGIYITSLYKLSIKNNYHDRKLLIEFENAPGVKYWVNIDFKHLPSKFIDMFFVRTNRALYDTETHYVNIPSHYKKFRDIRIESYRFNSEQTGFYGGDKVLIDESLINSIISYIKF